MRIVFMGSPEFAVSTLFEIAKSGRKPIAVYTRAPARGGRRGLEIRRTPVHSAAVSLEIPVFTPGSLRDVEVQQTFFGLAADVAVVVAYGLILPTPILQAPKLGCLNLHASLLPRWRGAAPIQHAIMAGDSHIGIDVMRINVGLDTGPVAIREVIPILPIETAGELTSRLATIAAKLAVEALNSIQSNLLDFREQSSIGICYSRKITKSEAEIDWTQSAEAVQKTIHALSPIPGAFSNVLIGDKEEKIKILRVEVVIDNGVPGTLLSDEMRIACGVNSVRVIQGQRAGKSVMSGEELMRGAALSPGVVFRRRMDHPLQDETEELSPPA